MKCVRNFVVASYNHLGGKGYVTTWL